MRRSLVLATCCLVAACGPTRDFGDETPDGADDAFDAVDLGAPTDTSDRAIPDVVERPDAFDVVDAVDAIDAIDALDASDATDAVDAPVDAGPTGRCTPTVDGTIGTDWGSDQLLTTSSTASSWGAGLNELRALHVCYDATNLYVGIEGTVEAANGIVLYLDRDYDPTGATVTGISVFSALQDHVGTLDSRVSAALTIASGAGAFGAEGAWGTAGLASVPESTTSDTVGLRLFWPAGGPGPDGGTLPDRRSNFAWMTGAATVCTPSASQCEVAIAWTSLFEGPRPAHGAVAMFARINSGDGTMSSNQTLPMDNPIASRIVNQVLVLRYAP
jgi:hypothetical protein